MASRTSEGKVRPRPYHHQCSAVWEETPKWRPWGAGGLGELADDVAVRAPSGRAFQGVTSEAYMAKPSQCSATGTT